MMLVVAEDVQVNSTVQVIHEAAFTGNPGDSKIFVTPVESAFTIRTDKSELQGGPRGGRPLPGGCRGPARAGEAAAEASLDLAPLGLFFRRDERDGLAGAAHAAGAPDAVGEEQLGVR